MLIIIQRILSYHILKLSKQKSMLESHSKRHLCLDDWTVGGESHPMSVWSVILQSLHVHECLVWVKDETSLLDGVALGCRCCHCWSLALGAKHFLTYRKCMMSVQEWVLWKMMNDAWCMLGVWQSSCSLLSMFSPLIHFAFSCCLWPG